MTPITSPTKEQVRDYMAARQRDESPPADSDEIRRQLGWHLVPENRAVPEDPM